MTGTTNATSVHFFILRFNFRLIPHLAISRYHFFILDILILFIKQSLFLRIRETLQITAEKLISESEIFHPIHEKGWG